MTRFEEERKRSRVLVLALPLPASPTRPIAAASRLQSQGAAGIPSPTVRSAALAQPVEHVIRNDFKLGLSWPSYCQ